MVFFGPAHVGEGEGKGEQSGLLLVGRGEGERLSP